MLKVHMHEELHFTFCVDFDVVWGSPGTGMISRKSNRIGTSSATCASTNRRNLLPDIFGFDSYIGNKKADIDPQKYQYRITYKALELRRGRQRRAFFAKYEAELRALVLFHIPSLKKDGKWNVITLNF